MPIISAKTQRHSPPTQQSNHSQVPVWVWILGLSVAGVLLLVGLESLTDDTSDDVAQSSALLETQPGSDAAAPGPVQTTPPTVEPLPAFAEVPKEIETLRESQTSEPPTSAVEGSGSTLTPEQIKDIEISGRRTL